MAIQLNRINVEIRENLSSEVKDDIVSRKTEQYIDNKMKKPFISDEKDKEKEKNKKKKFFTVDGIKNNNKNIVVKAEIKQKEFTETYAGIFIDKIK